MTKNSNSTLMYLVPFFSLYNKQFLNVHNRIVKTGYYIYDEGKENYFGDSIFIKCPIELNIVGVMNNFELLNEIKERYNDGSGNEIFVIDFPFPAIFKSIVCGHWSNLKDNEIMQSIINKPYIVHIKRIIYKDEKAMHRLQRKINEETGTQLSSQDIIDYNMEYELPFEFKKESIFSLNEEKYFKTVYYEED